MLYFFVRITYENSLDCIQFICYNITIVKEGKKMETKTWHFVDQYTGEEFFVESPWSRGARAIAEQYFDFPVCLGIVEPEVAEAMGLDTY